jgi:hypothetical protein
VLPKLAHGEHGEADPQSQAALLGGIQRTVTECVDQVKALAKAQGLTAEQADHFMTPGSIARRPAAPYGPLRLSKVSRSIDWLAETHIQVPHPARWSPQSHLRAPSVERIRTTCRYAIRRAES